MRRKECWQFEFVLSEDQEFAVCHHLSCGYRLSADGLRSDDHQACALNAELNLPGEALTKKRMKIQSVFLLQTLSMRRIDSFGSPLYIYALFSVVFHNLPHSRPYR